MNTAVLVLPKDFHHKSTLEDGLSDENDMKNIVSLSNHAQILGVKYIYTLIKKDNNIIFTSSSATPKELEKNENLSHFGDRYDDVSPMVFDVFKTMEKSFDQYEDKWGKFYTLYFPMTSEDGTQFIAAADVDISKLNHQLNLVLWESIKHIIVQILFLLPLFLVYQAKEKESKKLLQEKIQEITKELELKQKEIFQKSKMAEMGEMISNIAHQWRQPLSAISSGASGLKVQDELGILSKEGLHGGIDKIVKNTQYLSKTVENFRSFFTPNRPKEKKNITEIFELIDTIFGNTLMETYIELIKNIEDIKLNTYVNELTQVLINFIKNAKDAIGKDGGVIIIDAYIDDKIVIKVKDSGGGIPDDVIDKIYDSYFTTKDSSIGTGIGLHMSKQIIEEHLDGTIEVQNVEFKSREISYKGAEFTITLPKELQEEK